MKCPFTGKLCLNPKEIQVTELTAEGPKTYYLCKDCGLQYMSMPDAQVTSSLMQVTSSSQGIDAQTTHRNLTENQPCPKCGATLSDILKSQRVGCAECYDFHKTLDPLVMSCQAATDGPLEHVGKMPKKMRVQDQIKRLEKKMEDAVKIENYEQAVVLRDAIEELKQRLSSSEEEQPPQ